MSRTRVSIGMMLAAAAAAAVLLALPHTPPAVVETETVQLGDLLHTTLAEGTVGYERQQLCLCVQPGVVRGVYVQPGQQVREGQLLFAMDTAAQEEGLAQLQRMRHEGGTLAAFQAQQLEWLQLEQSLRQSVQAAQIRARFDGVVEAVYTGEGAYAGERTLLGSVRSARRCVVAGVRAADCAGISKGSAAVLEQSGRTLGPASVEEVRAPDESGMQRLVLIPAQEHLLDGCAPGEAVTAEVVTGRLENCALIPLAAVDEEGKVWYVEAGKAVGEAIDWSERSAYAVAAPREWEGRRVILHPRQLQQGCRVKEAKGE